MIRQYKRFVKKSFFKRGYCIDLFEVLHESYSRNGVPVYEARIHLGASGKKEGVLAYLYGIINGYNACKNNLIIVKY